MGSGIPRDVSPTKGFILVKDILNLLKTQGRINDELGAVKYLYSALFIVVIVMSYSHLHPVVAGSVIASVGVIVQMITGLYNGRNYIFLPFIYAWYLALYTLIGMCAQYIL